MSTPVVTNSWAGNFDCSVCRRKRLMAEEFSKKALEKHRKTGGPLKCKQCVDAAAQAERDAAAAKRAASNDNTNNTTTSTATRACAKCLAVLPQSAYNANQWNNKAEGQSKCRSCVDKALQEEQATQRGNADAKLAAAKQAVAAAKTPAERVAAESKVAALEAQKVTGLRPVRLGRGGRGRGRGGRGRR